jgi:hypothetical protein
LLLWGGWVSTMYSMCAASLAGHVRGSTTVFQLLCCYLGLGCAVPAGTGLRSRSSTGSLLLLEGWVRTLYSVCGASLAGRGRGSTAGLQLLCCRLGWGCTRSAGIGGRGSHSTSIVSSLQCGCGCCAYEFEALALA